MKIRNSDGTIDFPAELHAIALMLCTPSQLNAAWTRGAGGQTAEDVLNTLPFSNEAKTFAREVMQRMEGKRAQFAAVAATLQSFFWSGEEPHPTPLLANMLVGHIKSLPPDKSRLAGT